jgi:hypothetical protein
MADQYGQSDQGSGRKLDDRSSSYRNAFNRALLCLTAHTQNHLHVSFTRRSQSGIIESSRVRSIEMIEKLRIDNLLDGDAANVFRCKKRKRH